jgi:molybdopterin molybdotransferase
VPFEEATLGAAVLSITQPYPPSRNVRLAGEDVRQGELILAQGQIIRPQEVGMLAALGRRDVLTSRQPRVGILATGDELIAIDAPWQPGKIRNANSYANAAQVLKYGGMPVLLGIARDRIDTVANRLHAGLSQGLDLLITSGGISVGDFDVVKKVLATEGEISFWQVRMRPGKPLAFGQIGDVPLVGLPGNPVAAMVSCELFVRPALSRMLGLVTPRPPAITATLLEDVKSKLGFRYYVRVALEQRDGIVCARLTGEQGSGILLSMVKAQGLAIIPEDRVGLQAGELIQVIPI